jgi:hypothetical protein
LAFPSKLQKTEFHFGPKFLKWNLLKALISGLQIGTEFRQKPSPLEIRTELSCFKAKQEVQYDKRTSVVDVIGVGRSGSFGLDGPETGGADRRRPRPDADLPQVLQVTAFNPGQ